MSLKTKDLVYMALYAALFVVLDYVTNYFNLFRMPQGGSLSFATIALILSSYHLGYKKGIIVALISIVLMFSIGSITFYGITSLLLDYVLGYIVYGMASLIPNTGYLYWGIIVSNLLRLLFSTISGVVVWETAPLASLGYNANYIIPTMIVDLVLVPLLYNKIKPIVKEM